MVHPLQCRLNGLFLANDVILTPKSGILEIFDLFNENVTGAEGVLIPEPEDCNGSLTVLSIFLRKDYIGNHILVVANKQVYSKDVCECIMIQISQRKQP